MEQNHKISYVNLKHTMMSHREYSHRATRASFHPTLGELLKWVEYRHYSYSDCGGEEDTTGTSTSQEDGTTTSPSQQEDNTTSPSHQVLELNDLRTSSKSTIPTSYPLVLSFHNLTYSIKTQERTLCPGFLRPTNSTHKILLNSISGQANEGEIMAVLGASGSGKSTLIDALADRISKDSLKGSVRLNGEELEPKLLKVISAYVMQEDLLFPMLTVEETLQFSAEFRLPRSVSKSKKRQRVQALIDQLGLQSAANTVIGDEGHRGVSGGERRRVSIGIDIIHDPVILFLDEPTSGLDSTSAFMVVKVLQRIAQSGSIVITSIHQPSYRILSLLDRLIFLSHGHTVYSGSPTNLPSFFSEFGHPIPENENRSEFALDLMRELEESPEGPNKLIEFNNSWQQRNHPEALQFISDNDNRCPSLQDAIRASISKGKLVSGAATSNTTDPYRSPSVSKFANPFWVEVYVIGKRSVINSRRMPELFAVRFGAILITGIIRATVFYHLDKSPRGAQERLGFFAFAISTTYYTCAEAIPSFLQERDIFKRETSFNAYRLSSYVISHALISLPALVILSLTFAAVTFSAVSLAGGAVGFLYYFLFILAAFWAGHSFVTFLSGIVTNVVVGFTVVVAVLAYFVLFSGFFMGRDRIPVYWIWFHYLSLVKYPLEGVLQNEFGNPGMCFVRGVQMFDNTPLAAVPEDSKVKLLGAMGNVLGVNLTAESCLTTGKDLLRQQGITDLGKMSCLWITLAWGFFFRVLFYLALRIGSRNRRR